MPMVYGTPMMIMAMEVASASAVQPHLPDGWVTVGSEVNVRHLAPSPIGANIVATAKVIEVSGRSVLFAVEAFDGERKIGEGQHRRGAVNLDRFRERYARRERRGVGASGARSPCILGRSRTIRRRRRFVGKAEARFESFSSQ